jgi:hypothetical protein
MPVNQVSATAVATETGLQQILQYLTYLQPWLPMCKRNGQLYYLKPFPQSQTRCYNRRHSVIALSDPDGGVWVGPDTRELRAAIVSAQEGALLTFNDALPVPLAEGDLPVPSCYETRARLSRIFG